MRRIRNTWRLLNVHNTFKGCLLPAVGNILEGLPFGEPLNQRQFSSCPLFRNPSIISWRSRVFIIPIFIHFSFHKKIENKRKQNLPVSSNTTKRQSEIFSRNRVASLTDSLHRINWVCSVLREIFVAVSWCTNRLSFARQLTDWKLDRRACVQYSCLFVFCDGDLYRQQNRCVDLLCVFWQGNKYWKRLASDRFLTVYVTVN